MGLPGKELGSILGRLQNEFAASYARLHKHRRECTLCECVGKARTGVDVSECLVSGSGQMALNINQ